MTKETLRKTGVHSTRCSDRKIRALRENVVQWFSKYGRDFPWRRESDPFHIFLAEMLLRKTQATRLVQPYLELTRRYPDAFALADADISELRAWFRPLGLVMRADRLVKTAHILVESYGGKVPRDFEAILALPGMGKYSTRAILCIAFGQPYSMVDEGSGRVLRRVFDMPARGPAYSDATVLQLAQTILPMASYREYNLGLIDIAAIYCHVKRPECTLCPLIDLCARARIAEKHM